MLSAKNTHKYRTRRFLSRPRRSGAGSPGGAAADRPACSVVYVTVASGSRWDDVIADLRAAGFHIRPAPMPETPKPSSLPVLLSAREV